MIDKNKIISIIGMTLDMGAGTLGSRLGPEAIRLAGLREGLDRLGLKSKDYGDLDIENEYRLLKSEDKMNHRDLILEGNKKLYKRVSEVLSKDEFPLVLGGDHSLVLASMKAVLDSYKSAGLIYFDAHADINTTDSSPSGNIHGMPLSMLMGYGDKDFANIGGSENRLKAENIVFIGVSDLDPGEIEFLKDMQIKTYSIDEVHEKGIGNVTRSAVSYLNERTDGVHVSFDVDVMDPLYAPGTGINLNGGLSFREARLAMTELAGLNKLTSLDLVEVNPLRDINNQTAEMAVQLILTALGQKTY